MFDYSVKFTAIDEISAKIDRINAKIAGVAKKAKDASKKMNFTAKIRLKTSEAFAKIKQLKNEIKSIALKSVVVGGIGLAGVAKSISTVRNYGLAFRDVKKAVNGTPEELSALRNKMKNFSGASFEMVAGVVAEAGKMGFVAKNVMAFADSVIKGAVALDFNAELAVGQVGKILSMTNQMKNAVSAGKDIMDKVVNLENNLAGVKGAGVVDIWKRNADLYSQLNFNNASMGAMSGFLEQVSVSSELGASSFQMMIDSFKKSKEGIKFFDEIKLNGLDGLKNVMNDISKMSKTDRIKKFGSGAMKLIDKLLNQKNIKKLDYALEVSINSKGAVEKEWKNYMETLDQALNGVSKQTSNILDSIGIMFVPAIMRMAEGFKSFSETIQGFIKNNPKLAKVIGYTITILSGLAVVAGTVAIAMMAIDATVFIWAGAIGVVIGALVALYVYWGDIVALVKAGTADIQKWWDSWNLDKAKTAVKDWWNSWSVGDITMGAKEKVSDFYNYMSEIPSKIRSIFSEMFSGVEVPPQIQTILKAISIPFLGLIATIKFAKDTLSTLWDGVTNSEAVTSSLSGIGEFLTPIYDIFVNIAGVISGVIRGMGEWASSFGFVDSAIAFINQLTQPIQAVINLISGLIDKMNIMEGIRSKIGDIGDAIGSTYDSVVNYVTGDSENARETARDKSNSLSETNTSRNKSMQTVDIMVRAEEGTNAVAHHKENGNTRKLRTNRNGKDNRK